jgi:hypothetical protein
VTEAPPAPSGRTIVMSGGSRGIGLAILVAAGTGRTLIDADVLAAAGVRDLSRYGGGDAPTLDLSFDPPDPVIPQKRADMTDTPTRTAIVSGQVIYAAGGPRA